MKKSYIYSVYARLNGKPAGFVGAYATRDEAQTKRQKASISCIIKRELADADVVQSMRDGMDYGDALRATGRYPQKL